MDKITALISLLLMWPVVAVDYYTMKELKDADLQGDQLFTTTHPVGRTRCAAMCFSKLPDCLGMRIYPDDSCVLISNVDAMTTSAPKDHMVYIYDLLAVIDSIGYKDYKNNRYLLLADEKKKWVECNPWCASLYPGSHMMIIEDQFDVDHGLDLTDNDKWWIGINDIDVEVDVENISPGAPKLKNGNMTEFIDFGIDWKQGDGRNKDDKDCVETDDKDSEFKECNDKTNAFICEIRL